MQKDEPHLQMTALAELKVTDWAILTASAAVSQSIRAIAVIDVFAWHQERGGRVFVLLRRVYRRAPGRPQEPRREFRLRLAARLRLIRCHLGIGWHATADVEDAMVFGIAKAAPPLNQPVIVVALVVPILPLLVGRGAWVKSAPSQVRRE
jgi:hypothetical protein